MISPKVLTGLPRPVGSKFRQREVFAQFGFGSEARHVPWIVSVVDSLAGPSVEAKAHSGCGAVVMTDVSTHGRYEILDVLAKTLELLAADGWKQRTVEACDVSGCDNPLPMWLSGKRHYDTRECLACSMRTVLECRECGVPDTAHSMNREHLLRESLCFTCEVWTVRLAEPPEIITEDGGYYAIGNGRGPKSAKGFGGAEWTITFTDGRVVQTDDLWSGGQVPDWFRDRFPANAAVERREARA